jgi:hypothetical protein
MTRCRSLLSGVPMGRFPRFIAPMSALRLLVARRLALRCLHAPPTPLAHPRARGNAEISQVPGQPLCTRPALRPRQSHCAGPFGPCLATGAAVSPPLPTPRRPLPLQGFRGSITRLVHLLSTLRGHGHPCTALRPRKTRSRLVGQPCRSGLSPAGCYVRFPSYATWLPPHPGFAWRT